VTVPSGDEGSAGCWGLCRLALGDAGCPDDGAGSVYRHLRARCHSGCEVDDILVRRADRVLAGGGRWGDVRRGARGAEVLTEAWAEDRGARICRGIELSGSAEPERLLGVWRPVASATFRSFGLQSDLVT